MRTIRQGLVVAIALISTVAFTSTAMAGKGGVPGANQSAPGQAGTSPGQAGALGSPGQVWKSEQGTPGALSPGQQYKQDRGLNSLTTPALPPGQTFGTPGN